jgi:hypothetical protein
VKVKREGETKQQSITSLQSTSLHRLDRFFVFSQGTEYNEVIILVIELNAHVFNNNNKT